MPVSAQPAAIEQTASRQSLLRAAVEQGLLNDETLSVGIVDESSVIATIDSLKAAFPKHFEHTFAAKANTMRAVLAIMREQGLGCEAASAGELRAALDAGFEPANIVYDEPAKTKAILRTLIAGGVSFNIDNFQEYERVAGLTREHTPRARIGFRINPQVGSGAIGAMSTATLSSKFGVALKDDNNRKRLVEAYVSNPWLNSIHTHIGSQGCSLDLMVGGIREVYDLVRDINAAAGKQQITTIDIGGGLPVNFSDDSITPTFAEYAEKLREQMPDLFTGEFVVKTEFGRSIIAKSGFIATRVEYTKRAGGRRIAITHAGAQTATRTVFMPESWTIQLSVFDKNGYEKTSDRVEQDVAGPCCFAGDIVAHNRMLPRMEGGDYVVLHDTGAYYFSNVFYYNSLPAIAVYGANMQDDGSTLFDTWREQLPLDELLGVAS